jgi:F-type H+-transporting ATPase subunit epsilon
MIPPNLRLHIVTPDKPVVNETVDEVAVPAAEGQIGVLPGHTPTLVSLSTGELWYRTGQEKRYVAVFFGFAEILPDQVTVLAQVAERPEDIAVPRAEAARKRAQDEYGKATTEAEFDAARIALMKSQVRLQVATRAGVHA